MPRIYNLFSIWRFESSIIFIALSLHDYGHCMSYRPHLMERVPNYLQLYASGDLVTFFVFVISYLYCLHFLVDIRHWINKLLSLYSVFFCKDMVCFRSQATGRQLNVAGGLHKEKILKSYILQYMLSKHFYYDTKKVFRDLNSRFNN